MATHIYAFINPLEVYTYSHPTGSVSKCLYVNSKHQGSCSQRKTQKLSFWSHYICSRVCSSLALRHMEQSTVLLLTLSACNPHDIWAGRKGTGRTDVEPLSYMMCLRHMGTHMWVHLGDDSSHLHQYPIASAHSTSYSSNYITWTHMRTYSRKFGICSSLLLRLNGGTSFVEYSD